MFMKHLSYKSATSSIRIITVTALLSAAAYVLALIELPVPLSPSFARMDLSDYPALIGSFALGPICGLLVELIKNLLGLTTTSTAGIGELANFLMGASYVVSAGIIYHMHKTRKMAIASCITASFIMGVIAVISNYFLLLPLYETFMPLEQIIASFGRILPFIHTKLDVVLFNVFPLNTIKGFIIGCFTMLTYKQISPILKGVY